MSTDTLHVTRTARTLLFSSLDYGIKPNGRYTSDDFDRLLGRIAVRRQFANSGATAAAVAADPTALGSAGPRSPRRILLVVVSVRLSIFVLLKQPDRSRRSLETSRSATSCIQPVIPFEFGLDAFVVFTGCVRHRRSALLNSTVEVVHRDRVCIVS